MSAVDERLARQRAATYRYWRESVAQRPGGAWADLGGVQVHTTGLPPRHWNGAHLTGPANLDQRLPEVAAWFAARDKPWGLLVPDEAHVVPRGLEHAGDAPVMLRDLTALPQPPVLHVRWDAPAEQVAVVHAEAFGDPYDLALAFAAPTLRTDATPRQRTVAVYDGAEPAGVATVALLGDVAGIYGVAVREGWRRRGLGAALTVHCLHAAAQAGCDLVYLNPSAMAYGVYAALGFVDAPPFRIWVPD